MKKVLVTGASGCVGINVIKYLKKKSTIYGIIVGVIVLLITIFI